MRTSRNSSLAALALALLLPAPAWAATFSTNSFADALVTTGPSGNLSGNNYGGAGALGVSASGLAKGEFQSVLQFDLAGARNSFNSQYGAGGWSIQSVSLQLTATPPNNSIFNASSAGQFQVYWQQNNSWTEGAGTPNAPTTTGITYTSLQNTYAGTGDQSLGTFSFDGATSGAATFTLNASSGFTTNLMAGNDLTLRLVAADNSVSYLFDSRNFGTVGSRPLLTIAAVPEPATILIGGLGVVCLAGRGLFRRTRSA